MKCQSTSQPRPKYVIYSIGIQSHHAIFFDQSIKAYTLSKKRDGSILCEAAEQFGYLSIIIIHSYRRITEKYAKYALIVLEAFKMICMCHINTQLFWL